MSKQVKAMMSTRDSQFRGRADWLSSYAAEGEAALSEARAILAVSEGAEAVACEHRVKALPSSSLWTANRQVFNGRPETRNFPVAPLRARNIRAWWPVVDVEAEAKAALIERLAAFVKES